MCDGSLIDIYYSTKGKYSYHWDRRLSNGNMGTDMVGKNMGNRAIGRYIVSDARICHGQPVFRGTRILVSDVLEQVASGMAWEAIIEEWRRVVTKSGYPINREFLELMRQHWFGSI